MAVSPQERPQWDVRWRDALISPSTPMMIKQDRDFNVYNFNHTLQQILPQYLVVQMGHFFCFWHVMRSRSVTCHHSGRSQREPQSSRHIAALLSPWQCWEVWKNLFSQGSPRAAWLHSSTSQCSKMGPNCLVMVIDGTSQFKCPKMIIFFSEFPHNTGGNVRNQPCAATRLLLCQCVSEVADPSIIWGRKSCTGEVTWLFTCRAETASPHNISCFSFLTARSLPSCQEKEPVGGGDGAERIQFHSWADPSGSPAWVGKDFTPEVITERR